MSAHSLFQGIAVVVDDEHAVESSEIRQIIVEIEKRGGHVLAFPDIPTDEQIDNMRGTSFFVVDWNLTSMSMQQEGDAEVRVQIPEFAKRAQAERTKKLLGALKEKRFAPVFIFTSDPEEVREHLSKDGDFYKEGEPSHILIKSKQDVLAEGVFKVLDNWIETMPSALALKKWEQHYESAKNDLFKDFYVRSPYWPAILWKTFSDDDVPPSVELGNLISRNLWSRMSPIEIDMSAFVSEVERLQTEKPEEYRAILLKVLEGERFIGKEYLHDNSISPGDVFKDGKKYWINIRPECDCIAREGEIDVELYLLRGSRMGPEQVAKIWNGKAGNLLEKDKESIIFSMVDGNSFNFNLAQMSVKTWEEMKPKRIGRLVPPFSTRVQQRYAAFLQRPGLTRIPVAAMPASVRLQEQMALVTEAIQAKAAEDQEPPHALSPELSVLVETAAQAGPGVGQPTAAPLVEEASTSSTAALDPSQPITPKS